LLKKAESLLEQVDAQAGKEISKLASPLAPTSRSGIVARSIR